MPCASAISRLLPVLAAGAMLACRQDRADLDRLPRVDSAESVPLSYFASVDTSGMLAGLACTKLDPTGRSVRGDPVVIRVEPGGIYLGEELVVALVDGVVPEEAMEGYVIKPLYPPLLHLAEGHKDAADHHKCAASFEGAILLEMERQLPVGLLVRVIYTAGMAQYEETWLEVNTPGGLKTQPVPPTSGITQSNNGLDYCLQTWSVDWAANGVLTLSTLQNDPVVLQPRAGSPDVATLLALMKEPDWLTLQVSVGAEEDGPIEPLVGLFSAFQAELGHRGVMSLGGGEPSWPNTVRFKEGGPMVPAVRVSIGHMHGRCHPNGSVQTQCIGLDNMVRDREGLHCYD